MGRTFERVNRIFLSKTIKMISWLRGINRDLNELFFSKFCLEVTF